MAEPLGRLGKPGIGDSREHQKAPASVWVWVRQHTRSLELGTGQIAT